MVCVCHAVLLDRREGLLVLKQVEEWVAGLCGPGVGSKVAGWEKCDK